MPTFLATSAATATFDYCTLAQVKARASIASATTTHDTVIAAAITAASRVIDEDCGRIFYSVSATKYYTPDNALTLDHSAFVTKCLNLMCFSIPNSVVVSRTYCKMDGPSAIDLAAVHGLKL